MLKDKTLRERARLIDQQEFEAECQAIRDRIPTEMQARREHTAASRRLARRLIRKRRPDRPKPALPKPALPTERKKPKYLYQGKAMTVKELAQARNMNLSTMYRRLKTMPFDVAMTQPYNQRRTKREMVTGVLSNLKGL